MNHAELPSNPDRTPRPEGENKSAISFGLYLPKNILTNQEIESWNVLTPKGNSLTAQEIKKRIGVEKRYVANERETPLSMALNTSQEALSKTEGKVNAVIVSTSFPTSENLSSRLQKELGISGPHLDVHAACSGFTLSLAHIKEHEEKFLGKKILLVATERYSHHLHDLRDNGAIQDQSLAQTIFSDGASAMVFDYDKDLEIISSINKGFPIDLSHLIKMPVNNALSRPPLLRVAVPYPASKKFEQDGAKIYRLMCENIPSLIREAVLSSDVEPSDIKAVFIHQGTGHMVEGIAQRLPEYNVVRDFQEGNFSSASIPKALSKAFATGEIQKGDTAVLAGFGAGLFASVVVVRF